MTVSFDPARHPRDGSGQFVVHENSWPEVELDNAGETFAAADDALPPGPWSAVDGDVLLPDGTLAARSSSEMAEFYVALRNALPGMRDGTIPDEVIGRANAAGLPDNAEVDTGHIWFPEVRWAGYGEPDWFQTLLGTISVPGEREFVESCNAVATVRFRHAVPVSPGDAVPF